MASAVLLLVGRLLNRISAASTALKLDSGVAAVKRMTIAGALAVTVHIFLIFDEK